MTTTTMTTTRLSAIVGLGLVLASSGCTSKTDLQGGDFDDPDGGGGLGPASLTVTGTLVELADDAPLAAEGITLTTVGLSPAPTITLDGASFTLEGVTANSTFHLVAGAAGHRSSIAAAVTVAEADVDGVVARVVSEELLAALADGFDVEVGAGGVVLARAIDGGGAPRAGIPAAAFELLRDTPADGPYFLDAERLPDPDLEATSASGWVVYFDVAPGLAAITAAGDSGLAMDMPTTPVEPGAATIADLVVTDGPQALPSGVSFATDVRGVFDRRGCADCHSGNGDGRDLANLTLDGGAGKIYAELMDPATNLGARVDTATAEASLLLRMPSAETPPDGHPTNVFASEADPDYLILLVWIREGALDN